MTKPQKKCSRLRLLSLYASKRHNYLDFRTLDKCRYQTETTPFTSERQLWLRYGPLLSRATDEIRTTNSTQHIQAIWQRKPNFYHSSLSLHIRDAVPPNLQFLANLLFRIRILSKYAAWIENHPQKHVILLQTAFISLSHRKHDTYVHIYVFFRNALL